MSESSGEAPPITKEVPELSKIKPEEIQAKAQPVKAPEATVEDEASLLKSKLGDARKKADKHRSAVLSLGSIFTEDVVLSDEVKKLSETEVLSEAGRLSKPGALDIQGLKHSSQIASRVSDLCQGTIRQGKEAGTKRYELESEKWNLQFELEEKERAKGLRKLTSAVSKLIINRRIQKLSESIERLKKQEKGFFDQADKYKGSHFLLRESQEPAFLDAIRPELEGIRDSYGEFLDSVLEDGRMVREIRDLYMERNLTPRLERLEKKGEIKAEDTEKFLSQLKATLKERDKSKDRGESIPQELREASSGFYFEVEEDVADLLKSEWFVSRLAYDGLVYDELSQLRESVVGLTSSYSWRKNVDSVFNRVSSQSPITAETISYQTMALFDVARKSKMARAVFGETIDRIDDEIYTMAMDKSLSDMNGRYIDMLAYYPTPEAIRNLVIIAAADREDYRTVHANWTFCRLAKRKDFSKAIDQAEAKYPVLVKVRDILKNWTHSEYWNHPSIKESASDLALSLINSGDEVDRRLVNLSVETLPNDDILSMLVKGDVLAAGDVLAVRGGVELLKGFSETPEERKARLLKKYAELTEEDRRKRDFKDSLYYFEDIVRKIALEVRKAASEGGKKSRLPELLARFKRLGRVATEWQQYSEDSEMLGYLSSYIFLDLAKNASEERLDLLFKATEYCPILANRRRGFMFLETLKEYPKAFLNEEGLRFFQRVSEAYSDYSDGEVRIILEMISSEKLNRERAELLPSQAKDLLEDEHFSLVTQFPELYLASNEGSDYYRKMFEIYQGQQLREFSFAVAQNGMPKELALSFSRLAPLLMDSDAQTTRSFVLQNAQTVARTTEDLQFLNGFVGAHGKAADQLVRDYAACVRAGSVDADNRSLVLDFTKEFRVLSPGLFDGYKDASKSGTIEIYLSGLKSMAERMTSSSPLTDKERNLSYYKDLIRAVYPNNSGHRTSYENNETCTDKSEDLANFEVRPRYDIDLMSVAEVRLKKDEVLAQSSVDKLKDQILTLYQEMSEYGYDLDRAREDLTGEIDEALVTVREAGSLSNIDFDKIQTIEEKMFLLLADSTYGLKITNADTLKQLLLKYEFAYFDDIRQYIQGTSDRVSKANNQDYALLCELHSFFSDRIKEVNRSLVRAGWNNPTIAEAMPHYFTQLAEDLSLAKQQDQINKLRVDRLGLSDGFIQQVSRTLSGKTGRKYTPKQIRRLLRLYESVVGGLQEKTTTSPKKRTKALYGQLKAQRDKTFQAMQAITGEVVDPVDIHLGNVDLQELLSQQRQLEIAQYENEQFANYTTQRFLELFSEERNTLETELDKFESSTGKIREIVHGYITKTKESAHARMVGGVCVCGDNPGKSGERCQWNMPNYFQLVLQDPETLRCQGLALLHHFTDKEGRKMLSASLNPSSTYLYSVDEAGLLEGMMKALEQFAQDNEFDLILVPKNKTIRTNRTGGEFDRAIDRRVGQLDESYVFDEPKQFSYSPPYSIEAMDVVWKKGK